MSTVGITISFRIAKRTPSQQINNCQEPTCLTIHKMRLLTSHSILRLLRSPPTQVGNKDIHFLPAICQNLFK